jgi:transglutaminase-like putative cysteine protease
MAAQRAPTAPALALGGLSAATALGLARVFAGASWLAPALLAACGPHVVAHLARRRRATPPVLVLSLATTGLLVAMVVAAPSTLAYGIPTPATLRAFAEGFVASADTLRSTVTPVAPRGHALQLSVTALWVAASAATVLLARGVVFGAMAPALVLFVSVGALGEGSWVGATAVWAVAAAAYLLVTQHEVLVDRRSWFRAAGASRSRLAAGGAAGAVLVVVLGLLLGPLLPGARGDALFRYRDLGESGQGSTLRTVTPLVEIRGQLSLDEQVELFTVRADQPAYWRLVALDRFDGEVWGLEASASRADAALDDPVDRRASVRVRQEFTIGPLSSVWVPAAYRTVAVDGTDPRVIADSVTLVSRDPLPAGTRYTVESEVATPSDATLAASRPVSPPEFERYLALPDDFPDRVRGLAQRLTVGMGPYAAALRLQEYLREGFEYSLDGPSGHSDDALVEFLFETRRGFCEQFSAAYAAMARAVGLPARVAVGFTPGRYDAASGVYHVTSLEAHAWPEVYLDGVGWTAFEPTPGRFEPTPGDPTGTGALAPDRPDDPTPTTTGAVTPTTTPQPTTADGRPRLEDGDVVAGGAGTGSEGPGPVRRVLAWALVAASVLGALGAVLAAAIPGAKAWRRHTRRHADDPRARVIGAWSEAIDRLGEAGVEPRRSATPVEFALRHAPAHGAGAAGPPLMSLANLQTAALFAAAPPEEADADRAWRDVDEIRRALRSSTPLARRWRRRLDLRTLREPAGVPPRPARPARR